jgi:hypothetical protein
MPDNVIPEKRSSNRRALPPPSMLWLLIPTGIRHLKKKALMDPLVDPLMPPLISSIQIP